MPWHQRRRSRRPTRRWERRSWTDSAGWRRYRVRCSRLPPQTACWQARGIMASTAFVSSRRDPSCSRAPHVRGRAESLFELDQELDRLDSVRRRPAAVGRQELGRDEARAPAHAHYTRTVMAASPIVPATGCHGLVVHRIAAVGNGVEAMRASRAVDDDPAEGHGERCGRRPHRGRGGWV